MTEYAYPHFHAGLLVEDLKFLGGIEPGGTFPGFDLPTVDGGRVTSREMIGAKPLLV